MAQQSWVEVTFPAHFQVALWEIIFGYLEEKINDESEESRKVMHQISFEKNEEKTSYQRQIINCEISFLSGDGYTEWAYELNLKTCQRRKSCSYKVTGELMSYSCFVLPPPHLLF